MREDEIEVAIQKMPEKRFQALAYRLLKRSDYPGLNIDSDNYDLGEDAHTEITTAFLHQGLMTVSVAVSTDGRWRKLRSDCQRCEETNREFDVLVFVTSANLTNNKVEDYKTKVKENFHWGLVVHSLKWCVEVASRVENSDLAFYYLGIAPLGGDYPHEITYAFNQETERNLVSLEPRITGVNHIIPRDEVTQVEEQLIAEKPVLITGEPGTGKSGIAYLLADNARKAGKLVLLLDARKVGNIGFEDQLRQYLGLKGKLVRAILNITKTSGCRVILDQLDSVIGLVAYQVMQSFALDLVRAGMTEIIVISRRGERQENISLEEFLKAGFVLLPVQLLDENRTRKMLEILNIPQSSHLVKLARNLLNLEILAKIRIEKPDFNFAQVLDRLDLWEEYIETLISSERKSVDKTFADTILAEAMELAYLGLKNDKREIFIDFPSTIHQNRLISWGVIQPMSLEGDGFYQFKQDEIQYYLFARYATYHRWMIPDILREVNMFRAYRVVSWMGDLYRRKDKGLWVQFIQGGFDVN